MNENEGPRPTLKGEKQYPPTLPHHIGFPPMPESVMHESPDALAVPMPADATIEQWQEAYYNDVRVYARAILEGAARNAILTLPMHEAAELIRDVMAESMEAASLTVSGAAIASGHSEATHKRIRALEPMPSNHLLLTIIRALNAAGQKGLDLEELMMASMRRHPELSLQRLRELLPRYCEKKLIDHRRGRYYNTYLTSVESTSVRRCQKAIPSIYEILEGVMTLQPQYHVGHVRVKGSADELADLRSAVLKTIQERVNQACAEPEDNSKPVFDLVVLSGEIKAPKPMSGQGVSCK